MLKNTKNSSFKLSEQAHKETGHDSFLVPEGYFGQMEAEIVSKVELIASLENSVQGNHFDVPVNYFEKLPMSIIERLNETNQKPKWKELLSVLFRPEPVLAFASLLIIIWFSINTRSTKTIVLNDSVNNIEQLNDAEYLQYIDEYTIIELLASQAEGQNSNVSSDPYVQYLLDHDIEISQIENSL